MCTVITLEQKDEPSIATKDIKVYKIGKKGMIDTSIFISPFQGYCYIPDKLNIIEEFKFTKENCVSDSIELTYKNTISDHKIFIENGFHSFVTLKRTRNSDIVEWGGDIKIIGLFIIPNGAFYHRNGCGNIVSNQIIFKKFI